MESLQIVDISVSILSTISSIICIIVHYIIPKIRKNPGNFVLIQSYLQLLVDLNWIYLSVFPDIYTSGLPCSSIGGAFAIISIINFFYCGVISLEVYFQIKSKIISSHHKRIKIYYGISALLAVFVLVFGIITDSFGENFIGFCFYKKNSLGTPAYFILYLIFITFMWFTTIVSIRKTEGFGSKIIYQYLAMVVATTIIETLNFIVLMILLLFEENQIFLQFFLISASSLGGILAFFRLWNRELIREIKWKIFPNRMEFYQEKCEKLLSSNMLALNQEPMSIAEFFENNNYMVSFKQNLLKILCALTLRFDKGNNYVIDDKDWQFFFTENEFLSVMEKVNIKNFKKCTTYLVYDPNLVIVDYSTEAFKMIREKWKVNDLELGQ